MNMGQLMAVLQQAPAGTPGGAEMNNAVPAGQESLFAGLLQGLTTMAAPLPVTDIPAARGNSQESVPMTEDAGTGMVAISVPQSPLSIIPAPQPDPVQQSEPHKPEPASQKVASESIVQELTMLTILQNSGMMVSVEAAHPEQPFKTETAAIPAGKPLTSLSDRTALAATQAQPVVVAGMPKLNVSDTDSPDVVPMPEKVQRDTMAQPTMPQAGGHQARPLQKEAPITEGDKRPFRMPDGVQMVATDETLVIAGNGVQRAGDVAGPKHTGRPQETPLLREDLPVSYTAKKGYGDLQVVKPQVKQSAETMLVTATGQQVLQIAELTSGNGPTAAPVEDSSPETVTAGSVTTAVPVRPESVRKLDIPSLATSEISQASEKRPVASESETPEVSIVQNAQAKPRTGEQFVHAVLTELNSGEAQTARHTTMDESKVKEAPETEEHHATGSRFALPGGDDMGSGTTKQNSYGGNFTDNPAMAMHHQIKTGPATQTVGSVATTDNAAPVQHPADQAVQQVRERLTGHAVKEGSEQIVLRLTPEHLGELKLNMNLDGQRLKVEIVAENSAVRDSLLQHSDILKETLSRQNIRMESFDVTTSGNSTADGNRGQSEWRELAQRRQQNLWMPEGGYRLPKQTAQPDVAVYRPQMQHSMVDLHF